jgi:hypothetical protein
MQAVAPLEKVNQAFCQKRRASTCRGPPSVAALPSIRLPGALSPVVGVQLISVTRDRFGKCERSQKEETLRSLNAIR